MNATARINDQGQTVTQVPGQPGTVTTGRPANVEIAEFDVFVTIPGAYGDDDQEVAEAVSLGGERAKHYLNADVLIARADYLDPEGATR